jgi:hypothetical protein
MADGVGRFFNDLSFKKKLAEEGQISEEEERSNKVLAR